MKTIILGWLFWYLTVIHAVNAQENTNNPTFFPTFTAHYELYAKGLAIGEGTRRLVEEKNGNYLFESISYTTGLAAVIRKDRIEERSLFNVVDGQVFPLKYSYHQTGGKKEKHVEIQFDWEKKQIKSLTDNPWEIPLERGIVDKLLYQLVIMKTLQQGKQDFSFKIADNGKIKVYTPTYLGTESVKTGLGTLDTVKYQRVATDKERSTALWLAPSLHYLPIQVEHDEKGNLFTLVLKSVDGL